ncbi:doublesex cognate 73A isoform X2 [Nomia melanderi]|uniref:doublesex cognate 73A isoform X2 n=1 Tax=Nomia melanderi TaxID=2448451 RepID=UPI0013042D72|nr:putative GPI-anchored protein pfl2 isoform X2 [Nomia melanderi]
MNPIRELTWFLILMAASAALPSQTQNNFRGESSSSTPIIRNGSRNGNGSGGASASASGSGSGSSSNNNNNIDVDFNVGTDNTGNDSIGGVGGVGDVGYVGYVGDTVSKQTSLGVPATTVDEHHAIPSWLSSSSLAPLSMIPLVSTGQHSFGETIETMPTTSLPTSSNTGKSFEASVAMNSTTTTVGGTTAPTNASTASIETSSRTIASVQEADASFASKKATTSFDNITTTPVSISAKETRESPGKIRPQIKLTTNYSSLPETGVRLPEGASAALAKPTKYHYYPHNQHIYLLPECAVQQVCNAVYVRLNFTQPLCACPGRYRDPCSASLDSDDLHTTELVTDPRTKALTLVKTCEPVAEMRECRTPRDWSLLALQNVRTGKSHYLVICRCPDANILEGPMSHDQPTYASVPGIRVYGMMCVQGNRRGRPLRYTRSILDRTYKETGDYPVHIEKDETEEQFNFPWYKVQQLMDAALWD